MTRLPLSISPLTDVPPPFVQRRSTAPHRSPPGIMHLATSESSIVRQLCVELHDATAKEQAVMERIESTLLRMQPSTPPHTLRDAACTTLSQEVLTVDAQSAWKRSRSSLSSTPPTATRLDQCASCDAMRDKVARLERLNADLVQRQRELELDILQLRAHVPALHTASPYRHRQEESNVLLHDSTHKLLAEAERQLLRQDMSSLFLSPLRRE